MSKQTAPLSVLSISTLISISISISVSVSTSHSSPAGTDVAGLTDREVHGVDVTGVNRADGAVLLAQLVVRPGRALNDHEIAADIRRLWDVGLFEDVRAEISDAPGGRVAVRYAVVERRRLRAIDTNGSRLIDRAELVELSQLRPGAPISKAELARAAERIRRAYAERGYALAEVSWDVVAAADQLADVRFEVVERRAVTLERVSFIGNRKFSDAKLRELVTTSRGGIWPFSRGQPTFRRDVLDADAVRVRAHYLEHGYLTAEVGMPKVGLSADKREAYVTIPVSEGPRYRLGRVEVVGAGELDGGADELRTGAVYRHSAVARVAHDIAVRFRDQGFAFATVDPELTPHPRRRSVSIRLVVAPGPRARIETIRIAGNKKTRDAVIRRELAIAEGDWFSDGALARSQRLIMALGHFERVELAAAPGSGPDQVAIEVEVAERKTGSFQVGGGFSEIDKFFATGRVTQTNLFGRGQSLSLAAQLSSRRRDLALVFADPRIAGTRWSGAVELYNRSEPWVGFDRKARGAAVTVGRPLTKHTRAQLTYRLEDVEVESSAVELAASSTSGADPVDIFRGGVSSSLRATLSYDSRDDRLFPTRGTDAGIYAEIASSRLGSANQYRRYGAWLRHHRPLLGPLRLNLGANLGLIRTGDPRGVPLADRYQLGGLGSVRGYAVGSLGPRLLAGEIDPSAAGSPIAIGGNLSATATAEIEFPIISYIGLGGVLFFDVGQAYNLDSRYCDASAVAATADALCPRSASDLLGGLRPSVGFGVRWQSPLGPLRFEWGIPLVREPGDTPIRFHLGIGATF